MTGWETLLSLLGAAIGVALARMVVMLVLRLALLAGVVLVLANLLWQHGLAADETMPCPHGPAAQTGPATQALPADVDQTGCSIPPTPWAVPEWLVHLVDVEPGTIAPGARLSDDERRAIEDAEPVGCSSPCLSAGRDLTHR